MDPSLLDLKKCPSRIDLESLDLESLYEAARFDPMRPTVGDLVGQPLGVNTVEAAANAPPVVRRIDGRFDPLQPTVGDLVTKTLPGHTSLRTISIGPDDFVVHPRRVKGCSR